MSPPATIGVRNESAAGETRVAATPASVGRLIALGYDVHVEGGAGRAAGFPDDAYAEAGASITADAYAAGIVLGLGAPDPDRVRDGQIVVALLAPAQHPDLVQALTDRGVTALAMDAVPRISRAQSLDVLSSMANIAGYRAVIEAAHAFGRFFTGQVTAAGKVPPATVLVAGAGVAGLAAIGTASSLGAVVRATDPRPEVADQVRSLGGEFLAVDVAQERSTDGYARATSADYDAAAARLYAEQTVAADIIVTTALIPGRPAPRLITAEHVAAMRPGSVIVDMAAANGGNVEGTVAGQVVRTANGVTIIGFTDLAGRLPAQASQLYATNLVNLLTLLTPAKDGVPVFDLDDVVVRAVTVCTGGETLWPPPPVTVSAAPAATPAPAPEPIVAPAPRPAWVRPALIGVAIVLLWLASALAPPPIPEHVTVLMLSVVIGYYVIGKVHHALHTPLMSVTNAISGIIVVGALLQIGEQHDTSATVIRVLAALAILLASINVFGGFAVTRRMLAMFVKER